MAQGQITIVDYTDGAPGYNTALIYLYKRTNSAPSIDWTDKLTYTFSTQKLEPVPNGWFTYIPSGSDDLYVTTASAYSNQDTDDILPTEWNTPVKISSKGASGLNVTTVLLYQRNATKPSQPSRSITYRFNDGSVSGLSENWLKDFPSGSNPCWVIQATISSTDTTVTIPINKWTTARKMVENGTNGKDGIDGTDGKDGIGINNITEYYQTNNSTVPPEFNASTISSWSDTITQVSENAKYLWNAELIEYTQGKPADYNQPKLIARYTKDGAAGKGITAIINYYKTTINNVVPSKTPKWQTTPIIPDKENPFLWNYEEIQYTEGQPTETEIALISKFGIDGDKGDKGDKGTSVTISNKKIEYQESTSGTDIPTGDWDTDVPPITEGKFLWTKTTVTYLITDGETSTTQETISYSVSRQGKNGISPSITNTDIKYAQTTNGITPPSTGWSDNPPTVIAGQFMWTRTIVSYSDGKTSTSYSVAYNGTNGEKGDPGISITKTQKIYAFSNSTPNPPDEWITSETEGNNNWYLTIPNYTDVTYHYYSLIQYKDSDGNFHNGDITPEPQLEKIAFDVEGLSVFRSNITTDDTYTIIDGGKISAGYISVGERPTTKNHISGFYVYDNELSSNPIIKIDKSGINIDQGSINLGPIDKEGNTVEYNFSVSSDGTLRAVNGQFQGVINADSGNIGNIQIIDNAIVASDYDKETNTGFYLGDEGNIVINQGIFSGESIDINSYTNVTDPIKLNGYYIDNNNYYNSEISINNSYTSNNGINLSTYNSSSNFNQSEKREVIRMTGKMNEAQKKQCDEFLKDTVYYRLDENNNKLLPAYNLTFIEYYDNVLPYDVSVLEGGIYKKLLPYKDDIDSYSILYKTPKGSTTPNYTQLTSSEKIIAKEKFYVYNIDYYVETIPSTYTRDKLINQLTINHNGVTYNNSDTFSLNNERLSVLKLETPNVTIASRSSSPNYVWINNDSKLQLIAY